MRAGRGGLPRLRPEYGIDQRGAARETAAILVHIGLIAGAVEKLTLDSQKFFQEQRATRFVHLGQERLDPWASACLPFLLERTAAASIQVQSEVGISAIAALRRVGTTRRYLVLGGLHPPFRSDPTVVV